MVETMPSRQAELARTGRLDVAALAVPIGLYAVALLVRFAALTQISFPLTEGSAYYVAVAGNLVEGRGLVTDALWSYATPPLVLPRPAFELWQPLTSFIAAVPMAILGPSFGSAQLAAALLGSLLAPLTWLVARDAATRLRLSGARANSVAVGSGIVAAILGPFVLAVAAPDSFIPFAVAAVVACYLMAKAISGRRGAIVALGVLLGLAYLMRLEAIYLGVTLFVVAVLTGPAIGRIVRMIATVAAVGALVALPWWIRNALVFGTPLPGQVTDNLFLTRNEQIFAYLDQPTLDGFLSQGPSTILGNIAGGLWHNAFNALIVPAAPVVVPGVLAVGTALWLRRHRRIDREIFTSPLAALLIYGSLTFTLTGILFPIATLWGTFEHASGPLLVGLIVAALLGGDALVARVQARRRWQRNNTWLAPVAVLALAIPLAVVQVTIAGRQTADSQRLLSETARTLPAALAAAGVADDSPLITDRPIWLSDSTGRQTLAISHELPQIMHRLATDFGAQALVLFGVRGLYPEALLQPPVNTCFTPLAGVPASGPRVFIIERGCLP
jgi:hypothetical protein